MVEVWRSKEHLAACPNVAVSLSFWRSFRDPVCGSKKDAVGQPSLQRHQAALHGRVSRRKRLIAKHMRASADCEEVLNTSSLLFSLISSIFRVKLNAGSIRLWGCSSVRQGHWSGFKGKLNTSWNLDPEHSALRLVQWIAFQIETDPNHADETSVQCPGKLLSTHGPHRTWQPFRGTEECSQDPAVQSLWHQIQKHRRLSFVFQSSTLYRAGILLPLKYYSFSF